MRVTAKRKCVEQMGEEDRERDNERITAQSAPNDVTC